MKIIIRAKNLKLNQALRDYIEEKIGGVEKFLKIFQEKYYDHFFGKGKPGAEAWFEIKKESLHHQKGFIFRAECQMRFPKRSVRAEAKAADLKLAINEVKDELQRELKQYKEKLFAETKRKTRVLKKEIHLSPAARFYRKGRILEEGI